MVSQFIASSGPHAECLGTLPTPISSNLFNQIMTDCKKNVKRKLLTKCKQLTRNLVKKGIYTGKMHKSACILHIYGLS